MWLSDQGPDGTVELVCTKVSNEPVPGTTGVAPLTKSAYPTKLPGALLYVPEADNIPVTVLYVAEIEPVGEPESAKTEEELLRKAPTTRSMETINVTKVAFPELNLFIIITYGEFYQCFLALSIGDYRMEMNLTLKTQFIS